jgi:hypothetical protein
VQLRQASKRREQLSALSAAQTRAVWPPKPKQGESPELRQIPERASDASRDSLLPLAFAVVINWHEHIEPLQVQLLRMACVNTARTDAEPSRYLE